MDSGENSSDYMLGSDPAEQQRLALQHRLWRPRAEAAWRRAGLGPGDAVLDLGCGPGLAAMDLAAIVGPQGRVLGLESNAAYVAAARELAAARALPQLRIQQHDLQAEPLAIEGFTLSWCRWLAMFLADLEPLLAQLELALRPGGAAVFHEYVHWQTFGLHPHGEAMERFGQACLASFAAGGGDANVNRRLPSRLAARGWRIEELRPMPAIGGPASWVADWLEPFVRIYGQRLQAAGLWSEADARAVAAEMAAARRDPGSVWVGPTVLELRALRPCG
ncbi:MAG: methyltransferase domain-containing protein [Cyanobium sp.]